MPIRSDQIQVETLRTIVDQASHGFAVRDVLKQTPTGWEKALGNTLINAADAIVTKVHNVNEFEVAFSGIVEDEAHGLTPGTVYYLSGTTLGLLDSTKDGIGQTILKVIDDDHYNVSIGDVTTGFDQSLAGRVYYLLNSVNSDISGYKIADRDPPVNSENYIEQVNTGTSWNLVEGFITEQGEPGTTLLPHGIAGRHFHVKTGASNQVGKIKIELWRRTPLGVETLLRSSESPSFSGTGIQELVWFQADDSGYQFNVEDRIVFKLYTARVSGPSNCTITIYFEGTENISYIITSIRSAPTQNQIKYIFDRKSGIFFGFVRSDDRRWILKKQVIDPSGNVSEKYANKGNNASYDTLDDSWPDRDSLTYEDYADLINV